MTLSLAASSSSSLLVASGITALALAVYLLARWGQQPKLTLPRPPGPETPDLPSLDAWVRYQEWGREHGDLVYIHEKNTLILNNSQVAIDLLEKRARIYSDRETSLAVKLCKADRIIGLQTYSNKWRRNRRFFQQHFRQNACSRFYPVQYKKIHNFLCSLTAAPEQFMQHTMALSQSLMYAALYGLEIGYEDPLAQNTVRTIQRVGQILLPGFPALERFPWLRFMPSSFPGCEFKRAVNECAQGLDDIETIPFDKAVNNLKTGAGTSLVAELALENKGRPELIELIKTMGTNGFIAAADTTMSSIGSFLLTLTLNLDVQAKAHAEIDRITGRNRLPTFEDRQSLPYVEAIYREIMRLHPPLPLGINHVSTEDDFYMGYHIPKGCIVVPNIWAMNRDPNVYSEPDKFIPERFLDSPDGPFTSINNIYTFGFGRRVCVGRYMGDNTVWLAIASVLATLDLRKAKDNEGNEVDIPGEYTQTFFRHPKPYRCCIRLRDARASELILAAAGGV